MIPHSLNIHSCKHTHADSRYPSHEDIPRYQVATKVVSLVRIPSHTSILWLKGMGLVIRERMQRNAQILTIVAIHFIQKENITECALDAPMVKRCFATTVCGSVFSVERGGA